MRIWIDATRPGATLRVFSISLLERHLRMIQKAERGLEALNNLQIKLGGKAQAEEGLRRVAAKKLCPSEIWIELSESAPIPSDLPNELIESLPIRWMQNPGTVRERLQRALQDAAAGETVLAFSGDTIVDHRIIDHLAWLDEANAVYKSKDEEKGGVAVRFENPLPNDLVADHDLAVIAKELIKFGAAKQIHDEEMDSYIKKLRRNLPPYLFRVEDQKTQHEVERFLFSSNYKGSTDFLTKWVYPPLVWRIVKPLAARRVHPNTVTILGIIMCFAAVPFFAVGMWIPGLIGAYIMSVLDSVDGKLARVTFQSSPQGDVLDHGTDIIHPPFWYIAWAWGLSQGDPFSNLVLASLGMTVFYTLDRVLESLFKACTGRSIHGYTLLDEKVRTFISRRNVNLAVFTLALPLGLGIESFYLMAFWQAASFLFHLSRVITFWDERKNQHLSNIHPAMARSLETNP